MCLSLGPRCVSESERLRLSGLSLRLGPTASLWLLEDGLTQAFPGAFVSCRVATCSLKDCREKKRMYEHFSLDDDLSSTMLTIGAESLFIARR